MPDEHGPDHRTRTHRPGGDALPDDATRDLPADSETRTGAPGARRPARKAFPVEGWGRYRFVRYLGGGGMGDVYEAEDPKLGRKVALKFIRGDEVDLTRRFLLEARAQARVDHDNVCKVYEVGEVEGLPYIAMQYIQGEPLGDAARSMSLEQKLVAIRDVARGLHEAHRLGLVHRDVKPGNIMVERAADGRFKPYLMDFGLARDRHSAGLTLTGTVMGTPAYMPPEQALGHGDPDRRSDVYGLGAALYAVLAGRDPFVGDHPAQVLRQVVEDVPGSLRRLVPSIPQDVDAITLKCLRKSRDDRYPSARALAEDLDRYLRGDPVLARPSGLAYRLRMRAAKHRAAVSVAAVALLAIAASLAWAGYNRYTASRQAAAAQQFGTEIAGIEARARAASLVPRHDMRSERDAIRAGMERIRERMARLGRSARGPGSYALGRGALRLGDAAAAQAHLEAAWEAGYRDPEVAYALGYALGERYRKGREEAGWIADPERRAARVAELNERFRDPAVRYLRLGRGAALDAPEFVEALLAFYEERPEEAIRLARTASSRAPWMYEARVLEGRIHAQVGDARSLAGSYDEALVHYARAREALEGAAEIGRSDPAAYVERCRLASVMMRAELQGPAGDLAPYAAWGAEACEQARQVDPESAEAFIYEASLFNRLARAQSARGNAEAEGSLDRALAAGRRAAAASPDSPRALGVLGTSLLERSFLEQSRGEDPRPSLEQSAQYLRRAVELRPSPDAYNDLGIVYKNLGRASLDRGEDPTPALEAAVEAYEASLAQDPAQFAAWVNLGQAHYAAAGWLASRGQPVARPLASAVEAYERALEVTPEQMVAWYNLGRVYFDQAVDLQGRGEDPEAAYARAAGAYRRAIAVNPDSAYATHFYNALGQTLQARGRYAWSRGGGGEDLLRSAEALNAALERNADNVWARANLAQTRLYQASADWEEGRDPAEHLQAALDAAAQALEVKPDLVLALGVRLDGALLAARAAVERGDDPGPWVRRGTRAFDALMGVQATDTVSLVNYARLMGVRARAAAEGGGSPAEALESARGYLDRAQAINPSDASVPAARAELCRWEAEWRSREGLDPTPALDAGVQAADAALKTNPRLAEVHAVRGVLLRSRAARGHGAGAETAGAEARASLERAFRISPHLRRRYGAFLQPEPPRL